MAYKEFETLDHHKLYRVSRWIKIHFSEKVSVRSPLWDYATDENGYCPYSDHFNPANGCYVDYFVFNGRKYALSQFLRLSQPWGFPVIFKDEHGKMVSLAGYDLENYYRPIMIEVDDVGESVRVYVED